MRSIRLGRTEEQVSSVSLGAWPIGGPNMAGPRSVGWTGHDDDLALGALRAAWEAGIRHWDTADVYGNGRSEELIGQSLTEIPRDELFLATKFGWNPGDGGHVYHPRVMRETLERSLRNLGTDRVDLYYLHHCNFGDDDRHLEGAVETARAFQREGKIRYLGLSDWDSAQVMRVIQRVDPDVVQIFRTVLEDGFTDSGLQAHVQEHDLGTVFFSPLRHGALLGKHAGPVAFEEGDFRRNVEDFADGARLDAYGAAAGAISERFGQGYGPRVRALTQTLLSDTPGSCAIVGLRNPDQVEAASTASGALSPQEANWVRETYRGALG